MDVKTQKFLILGVSKSGFAAAEYILKKGGECYLYEELKSKKIETAISTLIQLGAKLTSDEIIEQTLNEIDVLIISPGAPINHRVAVKAKQMGKRIVGEMEFGYLQHLPTMVAVTGTNGKTTTVTLLNEMLKCAKINSSLVGNVGTPITATLGDDKKEIAVVEVSSFQLESVNAFCPHISCILNISPDHLERHYSMDNYVFLKKRIYKNQRESEYVVLNYDDETVRNFYSEIKAKVLWVSLKQKVDGGYVLDGNLYYKDQLIIEKSRLKLKGEHNEYDTLFAIVCAKLLNVSNESIVEALVSFKGIKHRIQFVASKNNVNYYNDSKATNTASTLVALDTIGGSTVLILGGSEKGEEYLELFEKIKNMGVKQVVITGASRFNMLDAAGKCGYYNTTLTNNFDDAVKIASLLAKSGDNVLLSPACASFDGFSGYEERGDHFIKLVEAL